MGLLTVTLVSELSSRAPRGASGFLKNIKSVFCKSTKMQTVCRTRFSRKSVLHTGLQGGFLLKEAPLLKCWTN